MPEVLLSELIDLPNHVSRGDFVLSLDQEVSDAEGTLGNYVVTPSLVEHFDEALTFIKGGLDQRKSRGARQFLTFQAPSSIPEGMARKVRIEYDGAIYYVMNWGDRQERIFLDHRDANGLSRHWKSPVRRPIGKSMLIA